MGAVTAAGGLLGTTILQQSHFTFEPSNLFNLQTTVNIAEIIIWILCSMKPIYLFKYMELTFILNNSAKVLCSAFNHKMLFFMVLNSDFIIFC